MNNWLILYCVLLFAISVAGGLISQFVTFNHRRTQMILSLVAGVMLGVGIMHLLPHAVHQLDEVYWAFGSALAGLLFMFFLIRIFDFHQHDAPCETESCEDDHHHHRSHRDISWAGLLFGLAVHTLIDGIALAVAFKAESAREFTLPAIGIFLAIFLHKPLDSFSITSLMAAKGIDSRSRLLTNLGFAIICPAGAFLTILGIQLIGDTQGIVVGIALGFSAGVFICISLSDLLPEVQFHTHDRFALSGMLILGIVIAIGIDLIRA